MKYTLLVSFSLLFIGCSKPVHRNDEITKVELARSGAWSDYGATISIDNALNYMYFGDYGKAKQKYFLGKFDAMLWDTLNHKLEAANFRTADTATNMHIEDAHYYELIVHWEGGIRRILRVSGEKPNAILALCRWIDTTYKTVKLRRVDHPIKFETIFHSPLPKPTFDSVKSPPPK